MLCQHYIVLVNDAAAGESVLVMPVRLIRCVAWLAHVVQQLAREVAVRVLLLSLKPYVLSLA